MEADKLLFLAKLRKIAEQRGGLCLSNSYYSAKTSMLWQCRTGHQWYAIPDSIRRGSWCPYCSGKHQSIKDMEEIAAKRNGKCLSSHFDKAKTKLLWECNKGHQWYATPDKVKRGSWCPQCIGRGKTINDMKQVAELNGGVCLSTELINLNTKLLWKCKHGHIWEASGTSVYTNGNWCAKCGYKKVAKQKIKHTLSEAKQIATERGGYCVSKKYISFNAKLSWKCQNGHLWKASFGNILKGSWCPICSSHRGEKISRLILEKLFGREFPKSYPKWLTSKSHTQLELDGYNDQLKIGLEYQGQLHFNNIDHFYNTDEEFQNRQETDRLKRKLCRKHNVKLLEIPYTIDYDKIESYIRIWLVENKIPQDTINPHKIDITPYEIYSATEMDQLKETIRNRGGNINIQQYTGSVGRIEVICKNNHRWETTPTSIKSGRWCPYCLGRYKSIDDMQTLALRNEGLCLSEKYINGITPLKWKCKAGHIWYAKPSNIIFGKWCPRCVGQNKTILDMVTLAKKFGGKCLSPIYINVKTPLQWECSNGHVWEDTPDAIIQGKRCPYCNRQYYTIVEAKKLATTKKGECLSTTDYKGKTNLLWKCNKDHSWNASPFVIESGKWCPVCAKEKRITINKARKLAESRGGACISDLYVNSLTPLLWKCATGHEWKSTYQNIRKGNWCPYCSKNRKITKDVIDDFIKPRGGICLSNGPFKSKMDLQWMCKYGHKWSTQYTNIQRGHWCPICAKQTSIQISDIKKFANRKHGDCLSTSYKNNSQLLTWSCEQGHVWKASYSNVSQGTWCPYCRGKYKTIKDMQELAKPKGGKCLSSVYISAKTKLTWECKYGHIWEATPDSIISKHTWCPICKSQRFKLTPEIDKISLEATNDTLAS